MRSLPRRASLLLLAVPLAACSALAPVPPQQALPQAQAQAHEIPPPEPVLSPPPPAPPRGLAAPNSDAGIAKLALEALTCPWEPHGFSGGCAALERWDEEREIFEEGKADATLVNMLEDTDVKIRRLAIEKLDRFGRAFRTDKALAGRVVAAAERERYAEGLLAALLGRTMATIDVDRTGLAARLEGIVRSHPLTLVRSYLVQSLAEHNPTSTAVRRIVEAAIQDPSWEVHTAAARAYLFVEEGGDSSCAFWAANLTHTDPHVVGECAQGLSQDRCALYQDDLLTTLERSDVALTAFSSFANALNELCKGSVAKERARDRAAAIARTIVERGGSKGCLPDSGPTRALQAVVTCDPRSAKLYLSRILKRPDGALRERALELYKGLK